MPNRHIQAKTLLLAYIFSHYVPPLVSILLPVYNGSRYIRETINSLLNQTYYDFELIIVDDCSTDNTAEIVASFTDERIVYRRNEKNRRIVYTLNRALDISKGSYCARIDADDIALPTRLEEQVNFLENRREYAMVDTVQDCINEKGERIDRYNSNVTDEAEIVQTMPKTNCLGHPSVMIRSEVLKKYRYRNIVYEDYDLWLRMLNDGLRIYKMEKPLTLFRVHSFSLTGTAHASNKHFINIGDTKKFYIRGLSSKEKLKAFNIKVWLWMQIDYTTAYYKKFKSLIKS